MTWNLILYNHHQVIKILWNKISHDKLNLGQLDAYDFEQSLDVFKFYLTTKTFTDQECYKLTNHFVSKDFPSFVEVLADKFTFSDTQYQIYESGDPILFKAKSMEMAKVLVEKFKTNVSAIGSYNNNASLRNTARYY